MDHLPEWYKEITKGLNSKTRPITPEKKILIDYLRRCIKELESE